MMDLLDTGTFSALELSGRIGMPVKEVCHHLEHIARPLRRGPGRLVTTPAICRLCGYTFRKRERYTRPGRCPVCRKGSLEPPLFAVEGLED